MKAVQEGMAVSGAAKQFKVPRKTLDDRIKGRVQHGCRSGPPTALTVEEERALAAYLLYMAEHGFPLTSSMALSFAWAVSLRSGTQGRFNLETGPGRHWWRSFRSRHPELTLRTADNLERSRANALSQEVVDHYFECLKVTLEQNHLISAPRQLFNCDETFLPLNIACERVVACKNAKYVYAQSRGTSEHITLLCGASAAGVALPPMIIFSKAFPGGSYKFDGPDDAVYAKSDSGWIDTELFLAWMKKVFVKYCGTQRPVLLFIDGHASHVNLDVIDLARENDIILFCLPPHTTHALQPLDVSVFKSLKSHFSKAVHAVSFAKRDFIVSKREFARVLKTPFERAFSISNIKAGFAKCGIYPFDPTAIDSSKIMHFSNSSTESDTSSSLDLSSIVSVNPLPIVSPLSSDVDNGTQQVPPGSLPHTSTPVTVTPVTPVTVTPAVSPTGSQPVSSCSQELSTPLSRPHVENPLVRAGLVPVHLADILSPQTGSVTERKSRRITGVRVLTSHEYTEMMREKDRKEKEAAEAKQKRKEEREQKRLEKEQEQERKRNKRKEKRIQGSSSQKKGKGRKRSRRSSEEEATVESEDELHHRNTVSHTRTIRAPDRYGGESSDSSTTECIICDAREPPITAKMVFWVDCDQCGEWAHTYCALGSNTASRQFICSSCSSSV